jgi:hypothetical protein
MCVDRTFLTGKYRGKILIAFGVEGNNMIVPLAMVTRGLLGNAHHEGLRVDGILQVSTRHRIPNEQEARFT